MAGSRDPHREGSVSRSHYTSKTEITARLFAVLDWSSVDHGLKLIPQLSRSVKRGDVLELICTDVKDAGPGSKVNRATYIGFVEVSETGLLLCGDAVSVRQEEIGTIAGFDETHLPNHLNVVIQSEQHRTGREMELPLDVLFTFIGICEDTDRDIGF